jgi:hypothetical protein
MLFEITSGRALLPKTKLPNIRDINAPFKGCLRYQLVKLEPSPKVNLSFKRNRVVRGAKEHHFLPTTPAKHIAGRLGFCYTQLEQEIAVEMHIHGEKGRGYPLSWTVKNCLHLRPEIILRAMPEGTVITVPPVANGDEMCWIMERGPQARDKSKEFGRQKRRSLAITRTEIEAEERSGARSKEDTRRLKKPNIALSSGEGSRDQNKT